MNTNRYISPANAPVVKGLEAHEVVYAKNQPEYNPLRTLLSNTKEGRVMSRWSPTPEQRPAIAEGENIFLELLTFGNPLQPILMSVGDPDLDRVALHFGFPAESPFSETAFMTLPDYDPAVEVKFLNTL